MSKYVVKCPNHTKLSLIVHFKFDIAVSLLTRSSISDVTFLPSLRSSKTISRSSKSSFGTTLLMPFFVSCPISFVMISLCLLKDKLIDIPEITEPGAGEVEEGYQDELAEEKEVDNSVLGAEELDSEEVGGGEGELG